MPKTTCMAIDDEYFAIELLKSFIDKTEGLELMASSTDPTEAVELIETLQPQIIFLDIQMPMLNGLELVEKLVFKPIIIFTTAYKQFALNAFDVDAMDYLVKPFAYDRFEKAVNKAISQIQNNNNISLINEPQLLVKTDRKTIKISTSTITFIEKVTDYVYIHTDTEKHIALFTLQKLEDVLPQNQFLRIHKSFIVSINKITKWDSDLVYLQKHALPIARARKTEVAKAFLDHNIEMGVLMK